MHTKLILHLLLKFTVGFHDNFSPSDLATHHTGPIDQTTAQASETNIPKFTFALTLYRLSKKVQSIANDG